MTFPLFWLISIGTAAVLLSFSTWWSMKLARASVTSSPGDRVLTLKEFIIGIFLVVCPIINTLVAIGCSVYIFSEVAPKIVLFGEKK